MNDTELIEEFLLEYAKSLDWIATSIDDTEESFDDICRKLCEQYFYTPGNKADGFLKIAFGYFWCKSGSPINANIPTHMLMQKMDKAYEIVAKENNW